VALDVPEISTTAESPNEPTFEELSGLNGRLVQTMSDGLELRFPHLAKVITAKRLGGAVVETGRNDFARIALNFRELQCRFR
jgi:hypothetical protein